jgi:alginate O-acetyltransferase complex protein AlgJ
MIPHAVLVFASIAARVQPLDAAEPADKSFVADFQRICAERAAAAEREGTMTVAGRDGWLFLGKELRHLGVGRFWGDDARKTSRAAKPDQADPLPAILDFKSQLDSAGIELLLVPVPPKAVVYADMLDERLTSAGRADAELQAFYKLLGEKKVRVLDLTDAFLEARKRSGPDLYCRQDSHWSGEACVLAAEQIVKIIGAPDWLAKTRTQPMAHETRKVEIAGDLWQAMTGAKPAAETLALRIVGSPTVGKPVEPDRASPVVLLGDSHNLVFHSGGDMLAQDAGLADQLAADWGFSVDLIGVRGSGATPARINLLRQARAKADYLSGKKWIVWCFAAREFTESAGWQKVPVVK